MEYLYDIKDMLCKELEELAEKGELSAGTLDAVDKITHSIKSIVTIMAMEDGGYSNEGGYGSYEGNYGRGGSYNSYARGNRGGYRGGGRSREGGMGGRYSGRRYSRDEAADMMVQEFERLMEEAPNQEVREVIQKAVKQLKSM